ncbi:MAG: hypothetical protein KW806_01535 [Candidatus Yanofskybacteria bacterium]|nr:hypothetical protein [Candidatus Yanofskybacteria bacterium]
MIKELLRGRVCICWLENGTLQTKWMGSDSVSLHTPSKGRLELRLEFVPRWFGLGVKDQSQVAGDWVLRGRLWGWKVRVDRTNTSAETERVRVQDPRGNQVRLSLQEALILLGCLVRESEIDLGPDPTNNLADWLMYLQHEVFERPRQRGA